MFTPLLIALKRPFAGFYEFFMKSGHGSIQTEKVVFYVLLDKHYA
jgi:hypothetical protein